MKTKITLNLEICKFQEQSMSIQVIYKNFCLLKQNTFETDQEAISVEIDLPGDLLIILGNRNVMDAELDANGKLIKDKHILLKSINIFDTDLDSYKFPKEILSYTNHKGDLVNPSWYWNCNGYVRIYFDQVDPLAWLFKHQEVW